MASTVFVPACPVQSGVPLKSCPIKAAKKLEKTDLVMPNYKAKCTWKPGMDIKESPHYSFMSPAFNPPPVMSNVLEAVGNTPLIRINRIGKAEGLKCDLFAKCEYFNAGDSLKVRISIRMVEEAEHKGLIKPGVTTLIEPSSGNTGIGMALAAAVKGYRCIIVMSEKMSSEKEDVIKALGAEMVRTPAVASIDSPNNHIAVAQRLQKEIPDSIVLNQYRNASNPLVHYDTTAEEILEQMGGHLDMIIIGAGTGGTVTGIGRKMKEKCPECVVVGVDPEGSIQAQPEEMNEGGAGFFEVEGIGHNFIPTTLVQDSVDIWYKCSDKETFNMARRIIKDEGILCGGSSGSVMSVAMRAAKGLKEGQKCVVLLADGIRNYMTKHLSDKWMIQKGFLDIPEEITMKHWWWNEKVSALEFKESVTLLPTVSCSKAIEIMKTEGFEELPVVDEAGSIHGVLTIKSLMAAIMKSPIQATTPVLQAVNKKFCKVTLEMNLGRLHSFLETDKFAVVVHYQKQQLTEEEPMEKKEIIIGVINQLDLVDYITSRSTPDVSSCSSGTDSDSGLAEK